MFRTGHSFLVAAFVKCSICCDPGTVLGELPSKLLKLYFAQDTKLCPEEETPFSLLRYCVVEQLGRGRGQARYGPPHREPYLGGWWTDQAEGAGAGGGHSSEHHHLTAGSSWLLSLLWGKWRVGLCPGTIPGRRCLHPDPSSASLSEQ